MIDLRTYLGKDASSLKEALDNSWRVAEQEWIPLLQTDGDSYAGAPHLHSVETWLCRVAEQCQPEWSKHSTMPFGLNAAELYILLSGVLFHDIGRAAPFIDRNHGSASRKIIEKNWPTLGIKDARFAREIGIVAEFHTKDSLVWDNYSVPNILPWGAIHTHSLGALLVLADELDTAFNRVAPEYMRNPKFCWERRGDDETIAFSDLLNEKELLGKGVFRNYINSVEFDVKSHIIKTSVRNNALPGGYIPVKENKKDPIYLWQEDCKKRAFGDGKDAGKDDGKDAGKDDGNEADKDAGKDAGKERLKNLFFHYLLYFAQGRKIEIADFLAEKYFSSVEFPRNETLHKLDWLGINNPLIADTLENSFFWQRRYTIVPPNLISKNRYYLDRFGDLQKFCRQSLESLLNEYSQPKEEAASSQQKEKKVPGITDDSALKKICEIIREEIFRFLLCQEEAKRKKYSYKNQDLVIAIQEITSSPIESFSSSVTDNGNNKSNITLKLDEIDAPAWFNFMGKKLWSFGNFCG